MRNILQGMGAPAQRNVTSGFHTGKLVHCEVWPIQHTSGICNTSARRGMWRF